MCRGALLAEREDGAAQSSRQSPGLRMRPDHWCVNRRWEDRPFALAAMVLVARGAGIRHPGTGMLSSPELGAAPWPGCGVQPSACCLEASLSSLGLHPLLSTEEPEGRAWLALMPFSPPSRDPWSFLPLCLPQVGSAGQGRLACGLPSCPRHSGASPWLRTGCIRPKSGN